jgi:hypothetical protein
MRLVPRALLAGGLGLAVSFLVACGGGAGLLSSDQANNLNTQLDQVTAAVASGNCAAATSAVNAFTNEVVNLPGSLNPTLRQNLSQDATKLGQLAARDCHKATTTTTPTTTNTTPTNTTSTTHSTTAPTTSSPSPPTQTSSPPATTPTNPGSTSTGRGTGGVGIGNGNGNGGAGTGNGNGQ